MQEEGMEKRSSSAAPAAKSAGGDQRKVENQQLRYNRTGPRRESGGKPDQSKSPVNHHAGRRGGGAQRSRDWVDRRPRNRSGPTLDAESEEVTVAGVQKGSRKGNLNHLLNFTFNPREPQSWDMKPSGRKRRTSYRTHNKELFLQANCQFVVSQSGDYQIHASDPDKLVDWNLIEQVRVFDHEVLTCPICLYPPSAARITRCGHVYCCSCILHYLSLEENSWRKCPICYDAVHRRDLKSVRVMPTHAYQPGQTITMRLMRKARGSTAISPADTQRRTPASQIVSMDARDEESCYSKLLVASADQVTECILEVERRQLNQLKTEHEQDSLEVSFIDLALSELDQREQLLALGATYQASMGPPGTPTYQGSICSPVTPTYQPPMVPGGAPGDRSMGEVCQKMDQTRITNKPDKKMIVYACAFSDEEAEEGAAAADDVSTVPDVADDIIRPADVEDVPLPSPVEERSSSPTSKNKDYFYFYQADDGQQIYLHSVNARCLMSEYGGLDQCPPTITGRVEALECVSVTEELRRRLRYLNHLPLTCQFKFAQLQLKPPLVSTKTISAFEGEFNELRRQRQRKVKEEKRAAKRQDRRDVLKSQLDTFKSTTIVQSAVYQSESPPPAESTNQETEEGRGLMTSEPDDGPSVPSFAQMLRLPSSAPPPVWPRAAPTQPAANRGTKPGEEEEEDSGLAAPSYQESMSLAIQSALDSAAAQQKENKRDKKKPKKKLLFTTTMNRASAQ